MGFSYFVRGGIVSRARRTASLIGCLVIALVGAGAVSASAQTDAKPTATDVGVTASTIRIAVIADVDNSFVPGLFKGSVDAVKGAAKYINANGGIAGRKLAVDFIDSKLNANDARNAIITACEQDFAVVGSAVLFLSNVEDEINCKDINGKATGLPDVVGLTTGVAESCSPVAYPVTPSAFVCDTVDKHPQTIQGNEGLFRYYIKELNGNAHGALLISNDTPDARRGGKRAWPW